MPKHMLTKAARPARFFGDRYALAALRDKRATLAGEIADMKKRLKWAEDALGHVDACLRLMDPEADPTSLPTKRPTSGSSYSATVWWDGACVGALRLDPHGDLGFA